MTDIVAATRARSSTAYLNIAALFLAGAALVFVAGFVDAAPLHSPAHDARHANGFACH